jgi:two-component system sensor kinase FixL
MIMPAKRNEWFSPSVVLTGEERQLARILQLIVLMLIAVSGLLLIFELYWGNLEAVWGFIIIMIFTSASLWLTRRRQPRLASFLLALILLGVVTCLSTLGQGIHDISNAAYPAILIGVSLLLPRKAMISLTLLTIAAIGWLVLGAAAGLYIPQPHGVGNLSDFIIVTAILVITGVSVQFMLHNLWQSLAQAQQEITERKRTEIALQASEERYRIITELISDYAYAYRIEPDGSFNLEWITGDSARRMTGYDPLEDIGSSLILYHPEDRPRVEQHVRQTIAGQPTGDDYRILTKTGQLRWLHIDRRPVWDSRQQRVVRFYGVAQDITERKLAEEALRASEQKFRNIVEQASDAILLCDEKGVIVECNQAAEQMTGWPRAEVLGRPLWDIQFLLMPEETKSPATYERARALATQALQTGQSAWLNKPLEGQLQRQDGSRCHFQQVTFPIKTTTGFMIGTFVRDITRGKQAEAEREQLIAELETKNAELERFTYTVSHDLKSPLITINGFLGFLEKDALAGNVDRLKADIKRIGEATKKMERLLNELLELSRIGRLMNPPQGVSFEKIVLEALELVEGRLARRGVTVEVVEGLPNVYGDRARLVEVVQNLVDNAAKFMGDQPRPHILIGVQQLDGQPVFFVQDNGIGIEPPYQQKVFGLFDKLEANSEGTGIGLALVKRIVEVHGGRIWVESEGNGRGSTFYFTLAPAPEAMAAI